VVREAPSGRVFFFMRATFGVVQTNLLRLASETSKLSRVEFFVNFVVLRHSNMDCNVEENEAFPQFYSIQSQIGLL